MARPTFDPLRRRSTRLRWVDIQAGQGHAELDATLLRLNRQALPRAEVRAADDGLRRLAPFA
jgi:hypothetical protein